MLSRIRDWLRSDMKDLRGVFLCLYVLLLIGLWCYFSHVYYAVVVVFGVLFGAQALFILGGGGTTHLCEPIAPRRLWMPVAAASFMLALLVIYTVGLLGDLFDMAALMDQGPRLFWGLLIGTWLAWGVLLWSYVRPRSRHSALGWLAGMLFTSSLAELLAAVASYLIVIRRPGMRGDPEPAIWGIVLGICVMLFALGLMLVLLFLRPRCRREMMERAPLCPACGYDLTGTLMAKRTECPECGVTIPEEVRRAKITPAVP